VKNSATLNAEFAGSRWTRKRSPMTNELINIQSLSFVSDLQSPTLNLFGSYFPAWMLYAAGGIVVAAVIRQFLAIVGINEYVVAPLLTYPGFAVSATWLIWLWFGR